LNVPEVCGFFDVSIVFLDLFFNFVVERVVAIYGRNVVGALAYAVGTGVFIFEVADFGFDVLFLLHNLGVQSLNHFHQLFGGPQCILFTELDFVVQVGVAVQVGFGHALFFGNVGVLLETAHKLSLGQLLFLRGLPLVGELFGGV